MYTRPQYWPLSWSHYDRRAPQSAADVEFPIRLPAEIAPKPVVRLLRGLPRMRSCYCAARLRGHLFDAVDLATLVLIPENVDHSYLHAEPAACDDHAHL